MMMPCEVAVKSVIPAIRAHIAKELSQTHKMKQTDIARTLGITQTAVSKYLGNVRGQAITLGDTKEINAMINQIASTIAAEKTSGPQLTQQLCEVCAVARRNGVMCPLCKRSDRTLNIKLCNVCKSGENCRGL